MTKIVQTMMKSIYYINNVITVFIVESKSILCVTSLIFHVFTAYKTEQNLCLSMLCNPVVFSVSHNVVFVCTHVLIHQSTGKTVKELAHTVQSLLFQWKMNIATQWNCKHVHNPRILVIFLPNRRITLM